MGSSHPLRISRLLRDMIANENGRGNANQFNSKAQKAPTQEERRTAQVSDSGGGGRKKEEDMGHGLLHLWRRGFKQHWIESYFRDGAWSDQVQH